MMSKAHTVSAPKRFFFFFFFKLFLEACGIFAPLSRIKPVPPTVEFQSPNHRTAREFPLVELFCSGRERDHTQVL